MPDVKCFMLDDTDNLKRWLRRYSATDAKCKGKTYHNGMVELDIIKYPIQTTIEAMEWPETDPRWPKKCEDCDYQFTEKDPFQVYVDRIMRRRDTGEEFCLRDNIPGGIYNAWWMIQYHKDWVGPDGLCLIIRLPNGSDWMMDGPSTQSGNKRGWTRTGTPPLVTASPSILSHGFGDRKEYHGWLRDGVLKDA